ncbi:hypothetical protein E4U16_007164 [Claviceps sp. LM84 group G4]|nr:hypothetical protein E4U33_004678 [Claviceps sp. LM78 group G4]KAG6070091.1 hypothetical protein E4U16_007164 [Claviceps sp. LM84 group G4]
MAFEAQGRNRYESERPDYPQSRNMTAQMIVTDRMGGEANGRSIDHYTMLASDGAGLTPSQKWIFVHDILADSVQKQARSFCFFRAASLRFAGSSATTHLRPRPTYVITVRQHTAQYRIYVSPSKFS